MRRAPATFLLLLAATVLLAAWALRQSAGGPELRPDGAATIDGPIAGAPAGDGSPVAVAPDEPAPQLPTGARPRVWIELAITAELEAAAPPPIEVLRGGEVVAAAAEIVAGDQGLPPRSRAPSGPVLVRVQLSGTEYYRRAVRDEVRALRVELGPDRPLRVRVVDRAAVPIAGAEVWCGDALDRTGTTDRDGVFECAVPAGPGVPVVVRKDGFAWRLQFVAVSLGGDPPLQFVLGETVPLQVHLAGMAAAMVDARLAVEPLEQPGTDLQAYPFFFADLLGGAQFDREGRARIDGLPRGETIGVVMQGPHLLRTPPRAVLLRGEIAQVDLPVPAASLLSGEVVDDAGAPVADVEIWAWSPGAAVRHAGLDHLLLPSWLAAPGVGVGHSRDGGVFAVAVPDRMPVQLGARLGPVFARRGLAAIPREPLRLVVPRELSAEAALQVPPVGDGDWEVRVDPGTDGRFVPVAAGAVFSLPLPQPEVADVVVRTAFGETWSKPQIERGVAFTGVVELPQRLLQR